MAANGNLRLFSFIIQLIIQQSGIWIVIIPDLPRVIYFLDEVDLSIELINQIFFVRVFHDKHQIPEFLCFDDDFFGIFRNNIDVENLIIRAVVFGLQFQIFRAEFSAVIFDSFYERRIGKNQVSENFHFLSRKMFEKFKICLTVFVNNIGRQLFAEHLFVIEIIFLRILHKRIQVFETEENADLI